MIVPSILIMAMEGAALIVLAALLRYVANEGRELAQTRARASGPETPMAAVERGERGIRTISWSALQRSSSRRFSFSAAGKGLSSGRAS